MTRLLAVRDVSKSYGGTPVLRDVSFGLAPGEVVAVAGRSGSGKSTLVKLLAGLDRPDAGAILVEGRDIGALDDEAASAMRLRRIGLVFQAYNLLPDLTVAENVRLPRQLAGATRAQADARAHEVLESLDVAQHASKRPSSLSGGEQQRVAIARALVNEPAFLLADEPTGSLDGANAHAVMDAFEDVNRRLGTTVLIVSHDDVVLRRAPRVLRLESGRLADGVAQRA